MMTRRNLFGALSVGLPTAAFTAAARIDGPALNQSVIVETRPINGWRVFERKTVRELIDAINTEVANGARLSFR